MAYPMYGSYGNQFQQAPQTQYQYQLNQPQQYQAQQLQQNANRIVEGYEQVKFTEIPVDGSTYFFFKADGSEIYSKKWLPNCTTEIKTYRQYFEDTEPDTKTEELSSMTSQILEKLNSLEERFAKLEKAFASRATQSKKEEAK